MTEDIILPGEASLRISLNSSIRCLKTEAELLLLGTSLKQPSFSLMMMLIELGMA